MSETAPTYVKYEIGKVLGSGAYGTVYKAKSNSTGEDVALKFTRLENRQISVDDASLVEISALAALGSFDTLDDEGKESRPNHHPNIVRVLDIIRHVHIGTTIVMGFMPLTLDALMADNRSKGVPQRLSRRLVWSLSTQLARALDHCHVNGVIHRDIKPANILLRTEDSLSTAGNDVYTLQLADFGIAFVQNQVNVTGRKRNGVVTLYYRAPEVALGSNAYTDAIDVWSFGCVVGEMILGRPLFNAKCVKEDTLKISAIRQFNAIVGALNVYKTWENIFPVGKDVLPAVEYTYRNAAIAGMATNESKAERARLRDQWNSMWASASPIERRLLTIMLKIRTRRYSDASSTIRGSASDALTLLEKIVDSAPAFLK